MSDRNGAGSGSIAEDGTGGKETTGVRLRKGNYQVEMRSVWGKRDRLYKSVTSKEEGLMFHDLAVLYQHGEDTSLHVNFEKEWLVAFIRKEPRNFKGSQKEKVQGDILALAKVALEEWRSHSGQGTETTYCSDAAAIQPDTGVAGPHRRAGVHQSCANPLEQNEKLLIEETWNKLVISEAENKCLKEELCEAREFIFACEEEKSSLRAALDAQASGIACLQDELAAANKTIANFNAERPFQHYREVPDAVLHPVKDKFLTNIQEGGTSEVFMDLHPHSRENSSAILDWPTIEDDALDKDEVLDMVNGWLSEAGGEGALAMSWTPDWEG